LKKFHWFWLIFSTTILLSSLYSKSLTLPGFFNSPYLNEQTLTFYLTPDVRVHINAPAAKSFNPAQQTALVLYALPNGNSIEQTIGRRKPETVDSQDDWHFYIQHIGAQVRYLRNRIPTQNWVVIYLEAAQKSWPAWKRKHPNHNEIIPQIVNRITEIFENYQPYIILSGHSGGGSFIFGYLNAFSKTPNIVKRISFLDSNYGYNDLYGEKIVEWLKHSDSHFLNVIAYNDSIALYKGKPFVSPTGGTWYRSRIMQKFMAGYFNFTSAEDTSLIRFNALNRRVQFLLKKNPNRKIFHTVQVERNGFIQGIVSGTKYEEQDYCYFGKPAYSDWIYPEIPFPQPLKIPPRAKNADLGSVFMQKVNDLSFEEREKKIFTEISNGNIPDFLRKLIKIQAQFQDSTGCLINYTYEVMPDYLAIGSNQDFCRIPMGPRTAQKLANLFGASLPTRKLVNEIYQQAQQKLAPISYLPVGNANELVSKFLEHNQAIEAQFAVAGGELGQLVAGIKKDVVVSNKIFDPSRPKHVVIYGWHKLDGQPIQPLTNIHIDWYVDYSHGIRLINQELLVAGKVKKIPEILTDPALYRIISDEKGAMPVGSYPQ